MKKIIAILTLIPLCLFGDQRDTGESASKLTPSSKKRMPEYYLLDKLEDIDKELLKRSAVIRAAYYLDKKIPNTASVCRAYVNALNNYPLVEDPITAIMQPLSPDFDYPKWEQLDIYEYEDVYIRIQTLVLMRDTRLLDTEYYNEYYNNHDSKHIYPLSSDEEWEKQSYQMYYVMADVNNDENTEDIIRLDSAQGASKMNFYRTFLSVFRKDSKKSFIDMDKNLSDDFGVYPHFNPFFIHDLFFYKGETYIKKVAYDYNNGMGFFYMHIQKFNKTDELETLCLISARNRDGE
jgi:hypothetical protein